MKQNVLSTRWAEIVKDFNASGLTQRQYCRNNALKKNQLSYWKLKLARMDTPNIKKNTRQLIPIQIAPIDQQRNKSIKIILHDGVRISIPCTVNTFCKNELLALIFNNTRGGHV